MAVLAHFKPDRNDIQKPIFARGRTAPLKVSAGMEHKFIAAQGEFFRRQVSSLHIIPGSFSSYEPL